MEEGKSTPISATPNTGYLFTGWSGDATGSTNPLTVTVDTAKTITANFAQDLSDDDGDGAAAAEAGGGAAATRTAHTMMAATAGRCRCDIAPPYSTLRPIQW